MKVVINQCYGGFGLSDLAYEKLIEYGIPVKKYITQKQDEVTKLYLDEPLNDGEIIFDRELTPEGEDSNNDLYYKYKGKDGLFNDRYWETWLRGERNHPLLIKVVEELGNKASGSCANLKIVEIPDNIEYEIEEYDGMEWVSEKHRKWD